MKNQGGRTRRADARKPGERATLSMRIASDLWHQLDQEAVRRGRSLSAEAEARLEHTFRGEEYLVQAQMLAYGPVLAVALAIIGRATTELSRFTTFPRSWADEGNIAREAPWVAAAVMGGVLGLAIEQPAPVIVAPMVVWSLLAAVKDPDGGPSDVRDWARPLRRALGDEGAARVWVNTTMWIRGTERGWGSIQPDGPQTPSNED